MLLLAVFLGAALASCVSFLHGLCPGASNCLCTYGAGCGIAGDAAKHNMQFPGGGCGGSCKATLTGKCGGDSNCLYDAGPCSGGGGGGCLNPCGNPCVCCGIPSDNLFFLTSFDGSSCSCGPCHALGEWFSADRSRFGCGTYLIACRSGTCVKLGVTDYGPSCFVENDAGGPVLDASPAVCQSLTGGTSCGWSDHFSVSVSRARAPEVDGRPMGPFNVTAAEFQEIVRVGRELELLALREQSSANNTVRFDDSRSSSVRYHKMKPGRK